MSDELQREALNFVETADLPPFFQPEGAEDVTELPASPPDYQKPELATTIGSQIASFTQDVDPALREQVANAFLFAQQAADKRIAATSDATSTDWYGHYVDVLGRIGWTIEERTATVRAFKGSAARLHKAIVPLVTAALAPVAGAAPLIVQVLESLKEMDKDRPWITLFSRASQRAQANQFQIAHVRAGSTGPRIKLIAFDLDVERSVTQVLFAKFATNNAELLHFDYSLSVNAAVFEKVAPAIQRRLEDRVKSMVLEIEI
ncbi:hypothetical protein SLH49_05320 [Cognatiyoonia sp. IB215446]|uniref:hypothetical protein n=1 Tax=Cognatiyoonia sp. IB215446 TaxID=3097355 RepID=UPI002A12AE2A|nr:hypothetical protein [Cognatiyoonia sp. IB215446]MDX8347402.1 hypothetical protein [Cognatiyoonia sp. IB215446]